MLLLHVCGLAIRSLDQRQLSNDLQCVHDQDSIFSEHAVQYM